MNTEDAKRAMNASLSQPAEISQDLRCEWFSCRLDVWNYDVFLFIGKPREMLDSLSNPKGGKEPPLTIPERIFLSDYLKKQKELDTPPHNGDAFGQPNFAFIRLDDYRMGDSEDQLILIHEALHIANAVVHDIGISGDYNAECLAYTQECLLRQLQAKILERWVEIKNSQGREQGA